MEQEAILNSLHESKSDEAQLEEAISNSLPPPAPAPAAADVPASEDDGAGVFSHAYLLRKGRESLAAAATPAPGAASPPTPSTTGAAGGGVDAMQPATAVAAPAAAPAPTPAVPTLPEVIKKFLEKHSLTEYAEALVENGYNDADQLAELVDNEADFNDFVTEVGITKSGHVKRFRNRLRELAARR